MIIIADSSPIISLSKVSLFNLLHVIFKEIIITESVYRELVIKGSPRSGTKEVQKAVKAGWILVEEVVDKKVDALIKEKISRADAESIVLAYNKKADFLLMDEKRAREVARKILTQTRIIGIGGFLIFAKLKGHIKQVKPIIDQIREQGIWISDAVYQEILEVACEM